MDLAKSIKKSWKQDVIIQSIIWNTIIAVFLREKNIDITPYMISIKCRGDTVLVKTLKPIINVELYNISHLIVSESEQKIKALWLGFQDFEMKFL